MTITEYTPDDHRANGTGIVASWIAAAAFFLVLVIA
jgi:hypothetical protein